MAVRLTAANALKLAIDVFEFDTTQFMELLETVFNLLFNLLREAKECDTKVCRIVPEHSNMIHLRPKLVGCANS